MSLVSLSRVPRVSLVCVSRVSTHSTKPVRWIGIFGVLYALGGSHYVAVVPCLNLSQISEFALVICSIGKTLGHIEQGTLTVMIWAFSILAVSSSYVISYTAKQISQALEKVIDATWVNSKSKHALQGFLQQQAVWLSCAPRVSLVCPS